MAEEVVMAVAVELVPGPESRTAMKLELGRELGPGLGSELRLRAVVIVVVVVVAVRLVLCLRTKLVPELGLAKALVEGRREGRHAPRLGVVGLNNALVPVPILDPVPLPS